MFIKLLIMFVLVVGALSEDDVGSSKQAIQALQTENKFLVQEVSLNSSIRSLCRFRSLVLTITIIPLKMGRTIPSIIKFLQYGTKF
jgi:hypothetical protein